MTYRFFRLNCTIRVALLAATIILFMYLIMNTSLYATTLIVGVTTIAQILTLIHYIEKTNRDLSRFLTSVKYSDFSQTFSASRQGSAFAGLHAAFDEVIAEFQRARTEKEEQYRYLQTVIQHIGLGLLAYDRHGEIDLINNAAKRLLRVTHLKNIGALSSFSEKLVETLFRLQPGEKSLVKVESEGETMQLIVYATAFKRTQRTITLVSLQNIESELAEQEMEAWQKLIRVLTHEIMNSVTPIASLASTVSGLIGQTEHSADGSPATLSVESREDIYEAAATIEKRSKNLLRFTDAYRSLTRIPLPNYQVFPVAEFLNHIAQLLKHQIENEKIDFQITVEPESLSVTADRGLVEQVLINLLLNAIHAVQETENKRIELTSRLNDHGRVIINVADNGIGIAEDVKNRIFTPFYTTKKDGSGIGLSLSRQIMRVHKGNITVQSSPNAGSVFTLRF